MCHIAGPGGAAGMQKPDRSVLSSEASCQWTWSHVDPCAVVSAWLAAAHLIFRSCIRKTSPRLRNNSRVARCLALLARGQLPPVASTFQRGCLQAFSGALDWRGLNSRQINYLQRIASEIHYRGSVRQDKAPGKSTGQANLFGSSAPDKSSASAASAQNF